MLKSKKNIVYIVGCLGLFLLFALFYAYPIFSGKQLIQPDIVHYKGGAKELLDYRAQHHEETYWSDAMFGGMPTYQTGAQFRGDLIKQVDKALNFLPKPANYLFLLFAGFFLLGMVVVKNWRYALLGATFFGCSTYYYIIIAAGHNGKVHTIAYFAPLLAGILLLYMRKKYVAGFIVTALFMGLQMAANHIQMTYYLFIAIGFLILSEAIRAFRGQSTWLHFGKATGLLALAVALGIGMNAQRMMANAEYVKETVRGKKILKDHTQAESSGMDKESITMWSYGKLETLNLMIPRLYGGGSQEESSDEFKKNVRQTLENETDDPQQRDYIYEVMINQVPKYWGDQPGTSGPAYQGAIVCFLAILGFVFAQKKYKYWILGATILSIMLAWGHHLMSLTDWFIDFVPFYNKFRAPSSILVVVELLFPLIAILGLYQFFTNPKLSTEERQKKLLYTTAVVGGFLLILWLGGRSFLDFYRPEEQQALPDTLLELIKNERYRMFRVDTLKALLYVLLTAGILFLSLKKKLQPYIALLLIGALSLFDLVTVNQRYLNSSNFVDKTFAENPFQTENNEYLANKAGNNPYIQNLLSQVHINKTLATLAEKDTTHYRIFNTTLGTFNETNTSYFKSSIGGYSAAKLRRYDDLINAYFVQQDTIKMPKILNMLNAKYFVVGNSEQQEVISNIEANGNAWLVSNIEWANTPNEELAKIGEINSKTTVVISTDDKPYLKGKNLQPDAEAFIHLSSYQPNELIYKTTSKTPQLAVFSEIFYPYGWKFFIDGQEQPYIKANYLLRAAYVPQGQHTIKMVFEPEVLSKGKIVSMLAFGIFLILSILGIFYIAKKRNAKA
ncbi:hypothetical protein [Riemerella columbina]|uniref:hypothetical protein n=1 Tax=Riemerella columbina TaxID=103810 RepID=UPI00267022F6|nr:hypothetical protein [Riemerella columbina]WKS94550.1 YfhO family protein [Riemerella columbina]